VRFTQLLVHSYTHDSCDVARMRPSFLVYFLATKKHLSMENLDAMFPSPPPTSESYLVPLRPLKSATFPPTGKRSSADVQPQVTGGPGHCRRGQDARPRLRTDRLGVARFPFRARFLTSAP
jgi:hypothetical protein